MKNISLFFILILFGCSGLEDSEKQRIRKMNAIAEPIYRSHEECLFVHEEPIRMPRESYPWESKEIGNHPKITLEDFCCKGNLHHQTVHRLGSDQEMNLPDCGGAKQHSLPIRDGRPFIYPALLEILNYVQEQTGKKVIVTCGHRCPTHNAYADSLSFNQNSKHMLGAEVDFYVMGMQWRPEEVVALLKQYYQKHPRFKANSRFTQFCPYEQETNVSTIPWYNKEIFIKIFKKDEGRDLDNDHRYPYISIQIKWDRDKDEPVTYNWSQAFNGYLRY